MWQVRNFQKHMTKSVEATRKVAKLIKEFKKRDGRVVPFNINKISSVVEKAMKATGEGGMFEASRIAERVVLHLHKTNIKDKYYVPHLEEVQDAVERELIWEDFADTARAFILYRDKRSKEREAGGGVPKEVKQLYKKSSKYFRNQLAEFVYYRTYARWIENKNRRETWEETVDRFMDFMKENIGEKLIIEASIKSLDDHKIICNIDVSVGERKIATGLTGQKILKRAKIKDLITSIQKDGGKEE